MQSHLTQASTRDASPVRPGADAAQARAAERSSFDNEHGPQANGGSPCSCPGCYPDPIW